jgi:hypothetical protein
MYVNITTHNYEKYNNVEYGVAKITVAQGAAVTFLNIGAKILKKKIFLLMDASFVI